MKERRAYIRVPVGLELTYQTDQGIVKPRLAMSRDLSYGGLRFTHAERLDSGSTVTLSVNLPREGLVVLHGIVIWCRESVNGRGGYQSGLKWVDVNPVAQARLNSFLTERTHPRRISPTATPADETLEEPQIVWSRAIVLALFGFTLLAAAAFLWLERFELTTEVEALRQSVYSYEQQLRSLLRL